MAGEGIVTITKQVTIYQKAILFSSLNVTTHMCHAYFIVSFIYVFTTYVVVSTDNMIYMSSCVKTRFVV